MGQTLEALLGLQSIERDLAQVRGRLRARKNAVAVQQRRIDQLRGNYGAQEDKLMARKKEADQLELELKTKDAEIAKLRAALNTAKTNKEYAAILTQINTDKADNARDEESELKLLQDIDTAKAEMEKTCGEIEAEESRLQEIQKTSSEEIRRLDGMMADLAAKRAEAVKDVPAPALVVFERLAERYDGEAMAFIGVDGKKPPYEYHCGGCFMSLSAENANILRVRDEVITCPNCGRILYFEQTENAVK